MEETLERLVFTLNKKMIYWSIAVIYGVLVILADSVFHWPFAKSLISIGWIAICIFVIFYIVRTIKFSWDKKHTR